MSSPQASQLYRLVERGAQVFDRIAQEMQQHDIDGELADPADIIAKKRFCDICSASANTETKNARRGYNCFRSFQWGPDHAAKS